MLKPKFSVLIKSLEDAINFAHSKRKYGACFKEVSNGYLVIWDSK